MASRLELNAMLQELLGSDHVYFQPPEELKMQYPAIRYSLSRIDNDYANNDVYLQHYYYQLIVLDRDPDSEIVKKVSQLPKISFVTNYTKDGLNHTVFTLEY